MDEGCLSLFRAFRGLPKNKALIKFLSEDGIRAQLQKTENFYMKSTPIAELKEELDRQHTPNKKKQKIRNELVRRGA